MDLTERQLEIINCALDIIADHGIQELSIRNLARKLGLYRHFENKEDMLLSLVFYIGRNVEQSMKRVNVPEGPALYQLEYITNGAVDYFEKNQSITTVFISNGIFQNSEKMVQEMLSLYELGVSVYSKMIKKAQDQGDIRKDLNSERAAEILTGSLRGHMTRWILANYEFSLLKEWQDIWKTLKLMFKG